MRDPAVFHGGVFLLIDVTQLAVSGMSPERARQQPPVEQDGRATAVAVAYLAPDEQTRRAATLLRACLGGSNSRRVIFETRADALAWLEQSRPSVASVEAAARRARARLGLDTARSQETGQHWPLHSRAI